MKKILLIIISCSICLGFFKSVNILNNFFIEAHFLIASIVEKTVLINFLELILPFHFLVFSEYYGFYYRNENLLISIDNYLCVAFILLLLIGCFINVFTKKEIIKFN